jgi:hypothetical protein
VFWFILIKKWILVWKKVKKKSIDQFIVNERDQKINRLQGKWKFRRQKKRVEKNKIRENGEITDDQD